MEIISTNALISINSTFFAQLISFLIFIFVLNKVMVTPLRKTASKRSNYINSVNNEISLSKKQLDSFLLELEHKKKKTLDESFAKVKILEKETQLKVKTIYDNTRTEIVNLQLKYDEKINQQSAALNSALQMDIDNITNLVMEKILDRKLIR